MSRLAIRWLGVPTPLLAVAGCFTTAVALTLSHAMKKSPRWIDDQSINYLPTPEQIAAECVRIRAERKAKANDDGDNWEVDNWSEVDEAQ